VINARIEAGNKDSSYGDDRGPLAIAHRGGAGLGPENTLEVFARSTALGFRYLETDARVTRDGVAIAFHDETLLRATGYDARVRDVDWAEIRRLRVMGTSSRIERVEDVLGCFPATRFSIDVKEPGVLAPLAAAIRRTGSAHRVCVAGGWERWLAEVRELAGAELRVALGWRGLATLTACARARVRPPRLAGEFVHLPPTLVGMPLLRQRVIDLAHGQGKKVIAWTIDEPAKINQLLDRGVDGIITDRPDVLREVLVARGAWTPMRTAAVRSEA
jgi:glycerophosphoryl diester phosphodiesterase